MSLLRRILFAAFAPATLVLAAGAAMAGPFTDLVVFGDSLSDVGNIDQLTPIPFIVPDTPGPYYYMGRFSNGPVYVDALAAGLGLPSITHSLAGGNDFAYGGAQTSGTGGLEGIVISDVDEQVAVFFDRLAGDPVDPDALFVVWAGANDLFNGQTDMSVPVGNLASDLQALADAGASHFLVPNLPLLGYTPAYNGDPADFDLFNTLSADFNAALATSLDDLETANPALSIYRLDVAGLIGQAIADPGAFGLTNVTDSAAVGLEPGGEPTFVVGNPEEYLFWDMVHPTTTAHSILAEHALALLMPPPLPGDYNGDGTVNAADYTVYRNRKAGIGGTTLDNEGVTLGEVTVEDYEFWKMHYGETLPMSGLGSSLADGTANVPEPTTFVLFVVATVFGLAMGPARFPFSELRRRDYWRLRGVL